MQNAKFKMQNCGVPLARLKYIDEADTIILHSSFCILHSTEGRLLWVFFLMSC